MASKSTGTGVSVPSGVSTHNSAWISPLGKTVLGLTVGVSFGLGWALRGSFEAYRAAAREQQKQQAEARAKAWAETKRKAAAAGTVGVLALAAIGIMVIQYKRRYPVEVDLNRRQVQV